jgi:sporulation protein YlmC with PRC-barrel domain
MKKLLAIVAVPVVLILATTIDGFAQQRPAQPADKPADRPSTTARETFKNTQGLHESGDLVGTRVKNAEGKDVGEIDQLLINPKDGKVSHVVVGVGGLAGVGERKVVVPWSDVKIAADQRGGKAVVTMDQAKLEKAPSYEKRMTGTDRERMPPAGSPTTPPRSEPKTDTEKK